jgi:hypothetical protein
MPLTGAPTFAIASRIIAAVGAGYAATVGLVALFGILLALLPGMVRSEAILLTSMIGFPGYAAIIVWGFAERRLARVWTLLGTVAIAGNGAAIALARLLPPIAAGG